MRQFWRKLHLWIGLAAGMVLVVIGLTGSALVFYRDLEEQIYADTLLVEPQGEMLSIDAALELAVAHYPEETVLGVMMPRHERATYLAYRYFIPQGEEDYRFTYISINPYTGELLGERVWGKTVMTFLYSLHYTLTAGETGAIIVGFIGILFLVSLFSGLYLWWPKGGKWKQALWFKKHAKSHRRNMDIHRVFGFYPLIILVTIAFSGVYMIFPEQIRWAVSQFSPVVKDYEHKLKVQAPEQGNPISYGRAIAIAQTVFPDGQLSRFDRPHDSSHPYVVTSFAAGQPLTTNGYNQVFIEPYTGEILAVKRWSEASSGDVFLAWQFPLHNGEAFGLTGRIIILLSGFLPAILYTTGLLMWLKRRKQKVQTATKSTMFNRLSAAAS